MRGCPSECSVTPSPVPSRGNARLSRALCQHRPGHGARRGSWGGGCAWGCPWECSHCMRPHPFLQLAPSPAFSCRSRVGLSLKPARCLPCSVTNGDGDEMGVGQGLVCAPCPSPCALSSAACTWPHDFPHHPWGCVVDRAGSCCRCRDGDQPLRCDGLVWLCVGSWPGWEPSMPSARPGAACAATTRHTAGI